MKHAFKRSDEEGGVQPVQKTKQPFVPKNVFEQYKSGLNQNTDHAKIFVGGLGQVCIIRKKDLSNCRTVFHKEEI